MKIKYSAGVVAIALPLGLAATPAWANGDPPMVKPTPASRDEWRVEALLTVGEDVRGYTPPGILDGIGAFSANNRYVRALVNHELGYADGYPYTVKGPNGQSVPVSGGARVSFFDIDPSSLTVATSGLAIERIFDRRGRIVADMTNFDGTGRDAFSRFCSSNLIEPEQFGRGRGLENRIYITGEEDGGSYNEFGGGYWALDTRNGDTWAVPDFGRGSWENVTELDTGNPNFVAFILSDDTSPFVIDADPEGETGDIPFNTDPQRNDQKDGAPLYLYVGRKAESGDFLARNGLRNGRLYVWVADGAESVADFEGTGQSLPGRFERVVKSGPRVDRVCPAGSPDDPFGPVVAGGSQFGPNQDDFGYATQRCLWYQARRMHRAFQFSRPEDVATNPADGSEFVLASTGVDDEFDNADRWGTIYTMDVKFSFSNGRPDEISGVLKVVYDGDDVATNRTLGVPSRDFGLRSPDNLDWADNGIIYVQEDRATELFGQTSGQEASIWRLDPRGPKLTRIARIDRSVVLDPTTSGDAFDQYAGEIGAWESSGILDVSRQFNREPGSLFLFDVQAHGITDQDVRNPDSRINDDDLKEGGQLLFLSGKTGR